MHTTNRRHPSRATADPNVKATLWMLAAAIFAVLSVMTVIAWAALALAQDSAAPTIAQTGSIAIGAISALFAAAMATVSIALRRGSPAASTIDEQDAHARAGTGR